MLQIKNFKKSFGHKLILDNVSVDVAPGSIAVFLGESGVGKSTLLRILNGLENLDSGQVILDDKKVDLTSIEQTHLFGMVFQQFNLFEHLSNRENITLALQKVLKKSKSESNKIAEELLKKFGLEDKANKYPAQLSGGQKQRLALARSLALKPRVICLDEPTSALDPMLTNAVAESIAQLARDGYIVLIATHDVVILSKLNCEIYLMQKGRIIESCNSAKLDSGTCPKIDAFIKGV